MQPTSDKKAIKKSYARLLKQFHPEDDPEGFQSLKEAFDEALMLSSYLNYEDEAMEEASYLTQEAATGTNDTVGYSVVLKKPWEEEEFGNTEYNVEDEDIVEYGDVDEEDDEYVDFWGNDPQILGFMDDVNKLYQDYDKRIDVEHWKELFINNTIWDMQAYATLSHRMIGFLQDYRLLPLKIWKLIGLAFDWEGNEETLRLYHEDETIDELLEMLRRSSYLDFSSLSCLKEDKREEYLKLRDEAYRQIRAKDEKTALELLNEAKKLYEEDPDLSYIEASIYDCVDRKLLASDVCSTALKKYPGNRKLVVLNATLLHEKEWYVAALEQLASIEPVTVGSELAYEVHRLKMNCYLGKRDYEQALENFMLLGDKFVSHKEGLETARRIYSGLRKKRLMTAILMPWSKERRDHYLSVREVYKTEFNIADTARRYFPFIKYAASILFLIFAIGFVLSGGGGIIGLFIIGRFVYRMFFKDKKA